MIDLLGYPYSKSCVMDTRFTLLIEMHIEYDLERRQMWICFKLLTKSFSVSRILQ